ncbi:MAG: type 4a pilus biogenesis protein PilO [Methylococcales bacterium]|nr:type 4a pilus biogenesis protein PilO [Methylococcales bacterium]
MNLSEINWDINASGTWPLPIKVATTLIICAIAMGLGIYFDTLDQLAELESTEQKEQELRREFEGKQKKVVNLKDYQDQLAQIEIQLYEMIQQMPTEEEVANLLIDISKTGLASGLEFRLFKPDAPIRKDFYSELPINIQVIGKYDQLGLFVSGLASLPRIVTVHDVNIMPEGNDGTMLMQAVVKTYNEVSENNGANKPPQRKGRK